MECKNCGTEYEGRFCPECGYECKEQGQTDCFTVCPQCGSERVGKGKFCVNCGYNYETRSSSNTAIGGKINGLQSFISERKGVIYKVYRYLIAGGMLLAGVIALLCLAAPTMVEKFFGEINPLCTGFTAMIGGKGVDVPGSVVGASRALLAMSIIALIYGGVQLYWAFKRPFKTVRNYFCWALDGAIVFILLTLGAVVSAAGSSEELAGAQVGAGFAICIVMGVFGLLLLGARIFFELKLFSWADSGLSEEQIAKAREKKERKPLDKAAVKKWAKRIGIPAAIAVLLVVAIVPAVVITSNIFRIGKVDKINIGDSSDRVIEVLGEPYVKDGNSYEYYDKEYVKLSEQIKEASGIGLLAARRRDDDFDIDLDEDIDIDDGDSGADKLDKLRDKLHNLTYKYIRIEFSSDKVTSVLFDANRCDSKENKKAVKSSEIDGNTDLQQYDVLNLTCRVEYQDGSLLKATAINEVIMTTDTNKIDWQDIFGNTFNAEIQVKPIKRLTSKIVELIAGGDKSKITQFEISPYITIIDVSAFSGCSSLTSIEIPASVTRIGGRAFEGCSSLTSIAIPASVTSIGDSAFSGCSSLTSIEIPEGVTSIGGRAFYGCSSLTSIEIPAGVTSIGDYAFYNCSSLTSIEIPASVTSIGGSAFEGCSSLTSIEIPAGVTSIGDYAFYNCSSLTSIEIPASVTSIGYWAFSGCSSLTSIEIPASVTSIGGSAFSGCTNFTSIVMPTWAVSYIPKINLKKVIINGGTSISGSAFEGCSSLTSIEIPAGVTRIGGSAFDGCSSLTSIEIPAGVTSIGYEAFYGCSSLTSIEIPASVTSIGDSAFRGCSRLTIYCEASSKPSGWGSSWNFSNIPVVWGHNNITTDATYDYVIHEDKVYLTKYKGSSANVIIPSTIEDKVIVSFENIFAGNNNITSIEIPASVTSIGDSAFYGCSSLTSIEIPAGVTSIGEYAFSGCYSLTIYCEASSKPSGWHSDWNSGNRPVVWNCKENDIADDGNIYYVADNGIRYALKDGKASIVRQSETLSGSIEIPSAVTYKGTSYSVTSIGDYAFYKCSSLTSIAIPASVTSIGYSAFYGCSSLTIYCEASSKPSGWYSNWNYSNRPVVWGHKISK